MLAKTSDKSHSARIFVNSFPKGGTHLVEKLLLLLGFKTNRRKFVGHYKIQNIIPFFLSHAWTKDDNVIVGVDHRFTQRASYVRRMFECVNPGEFIRGHAVFSEQMACLIEEASLKTVLVLRDPRDIVVSHAHYVLGSASHPLHRYYVNEFRVFKDCLLFSIKGGQVDNYYLDSIGTRASGINGWVSNPNTFVIKFEDLVGSLGGGGYRCAIKVY